MDQENVLQETAQETGLLRVFWIRQLQNIAVNVDPTVFKSVDLCLIVLEAAKRCPENVPEVYAADPFQAEGADRLTIEWDFKRQVARCGYDPSVFRSWDFIMGIITQAIDQQKFFRGMQWAKNVTQMQEQQNSMQIEAARREEYWRRKIDRQNGRG